MQGFRKRRSFKLESFNCKRLSVIKVMDLLIRRVVLRGKNKDFLGCHYKILRQLVRMRANTSGSGRKF